MPDDTLMDVLDPHLEADAAQLRAEVVAALEGERARWRDPAADGAHDSYLREPPSREDVERVWREFWVPLLRDEGRVSLARLKGELYDCHHLIMAAPRVYRHVTGGLLEDPTASAEAVTALADQHVGRLLRTLGAEIHEAEAARLRDRLARADRLRAAAARVAPYLELDGELEDYDDAVAAFHAALRD